MHTPISPLVSWCLSAMAAPLVVGSMSLAYAEEGLDAESKEFVTQAVNLLSDCSGLYEFAARLFEEERQPASAEQLRAYSRGARLSAAYLLATEAAAAGKQRQLGSFLPYVGGRAEVNMNRMAALVEQLDAEGFETERARCMAALPMQDEIVQQMRDASVGRD
jgi:hypothetical protein